MKKLAFVATILLVTAFVGIFYFYQNIDHYGIENTYKNQDGAILTIQLKAGDSGTSVLNKLEAKGVFRNPLFAKLWLKLHPEYSVVKKGYYEFSAGASIESIFNAISEGTVKQFSIALIEGLTLIQWLELLANNDAINYDVDDTNKLYEEIVGIPYKNEDSSTNFATLFCHNQYHSLEGCLLANTYFFDYKTNASYIIKRAYENMQIVINEEWQDRYTDTTYDSPYEMLIMASIIEKETAVESERGVISGVFDNRLKGNMRLQTDPTVIYGIGTSFDGNLTRKHLRQKTPYNTYVIKGLPITPIAMAGPASIKAAAKPDVTQAIYFVAKGDGTHQFSETLAEHNAAVRQYQLNKGK
nr:endolytic transglycosylase MltG [uncultured Glaciecola sp.]